MIRIIFAFLLLVCSSTWATTFSDLKFGQYQIADSQWNVSACTQTATCQIYSKNPGTAYKIPWTNGQLSWAAGDYVAFVETGNATNPWNAIQYNSSGVQKAVMGTGHIINMGTDYFFFVGNDNNTGQLFSTTTGMNSTAGVTWTGTLNPTVAQVNTLASGGSTTPLAAGQSAPSSSPTVTGTSTTNSTSSSSTSSSTSTSVIRPTATGNYIDGYVGTTVVTTTTTTPVTTATWSDGSTTTSNGTPSTTTSTTYSVTPTYGSVPAYSRTAPNTNGNSVYIKQTTASSNTQVTIEQNGNNNALTGTDSGWAIVNGNGSIVNIKQVGLGNIAAVKMNAWGNNIDLSQGAVNADANDNMLTIESNGNGNSSTVRQKTNSNTAAIKMTYDINTVNITQQTGTGNASYATLNGNWNNASNTQSGTNNLSLINISGDNNSATVNQTGSSHSTLLNLIGNKNSVSVVQTGTGDSYSLQQTCNNSAGCSVSVVRNK